MSVVVIDKSTPGRLGAALLMHFGTLRRAISRVFGWESLLLAAALVKQLWQSVVLMVYETFGMLICELVLSKISRRGRDSIARELEVL